MTPKTIKLLSIPVGAYSASKLLARWEELIAEIGCKRSYYLNTSSLNLTYTHPQHLAALQRADAVYADGASIVLASRILGTPIPERLCTTDLWHPMCQLAEQKGYSFFLMAGEEGLTREAAEMTQLKHPNLEISGFRNGYFDLADRSVVDEINAAAPDVLWLGIGDPRQTDWVERWLPELNVQLVITCGALFTYHTGRIPRAPESWRNAGFEWLFRWLQEPRAKFKRYFFGLPLFGMRVLLQRLFNVGGNR